MDLIEFCYMLAIGSVIFMLICGLVWVLEALEVFEEPEEREKPYNWEDERW